MESDYRIAVLVGSLRADGLTRKALAVALGPLETAEDVTVDWLLPEELTLAHPFEPGWQELQEQIMPRVSSADGVLMGTPEYNGSYSSTLKVQIDGLGYPSALQDKPVAVVGVASGRAGAIRALEHLHSSLNQIGAWVLPPGVSVPSADRVFDADGTCVDEQVERLLLQTGEQLLARVRSGEHRTVAG